MRRVSDDAGETPAGRPPWRTSIQCGLPTHVRPCRRCGGSVPGRGSPGSERERRVESREPRVRSPSSPPGAASTHDGSRMERQPADLPAATRPCRRDDPRRGAQRRRSAAVGAQRCGRVPDQSADRPEGLSAAGRRAAGREQTRARHVHQRRRARIADAGRTAEVPGGAMADDPRDHRAARPDAAGTAAAAASGESSSNKTGER